MPDLGAPELIIILVAVLIIFGPGKLPDLGRTLGKSIREFRHSVQDATDDSDDSAAAAPIVPAAPAAPSVNPNDPPVA